MKLSTPRATIAIIISALYTWAKVMLKKYLDFDVDPATDMMVATLFGAFGLWPGKETK